MEILFYAASVCLIAFMILATYDGFYLHLWKYQLFQVDESKFEHEAHTVRAILFPIIVWFLFLNDDWGSFWIGSVFVIIDLIVLGVDAYSEKDSRAFMGGLPKWEYIVHLFANGFHFAAIALVISIKIIGLSSMMESEHIANEFSAEFLRIVAENTIPGSIFLAVMHVLLTTAYGQEAWGFVRAKVSCC